MPEGTDRTPVPAMKGMLAVFSHHPVTGDVATVRLTKDDNYSMNMPFKDFVVGLCDHYGVPLMDRDNIPED